MTCTHLTTLRRAVAGGLLPGALTAAIVLAACTAHTANHVSAPRSHAGSSVPAAPITQTPKPVPTKTALPAVFEGTVSPLPGWLASRMRGTTWRPGCPVSLGDLSLLRVRYWGFDHRVHAGLMVTNSAVARQIVYVFRRIFQAHFPIEQMHLTHRYVPGHEDPNDARDWTASFNCRVAVTAHGPRTNWSQHAYGLAIDINPIQNPYIASDGFIENYHARHYRNRSLQRMGMIHDGDAVVRAFEAIGWFWGGDWSHDKDYMHFSWNGH
jgi:D-alanyl-D-alanine carboxypeptidase